MPDIDARSDVRPPCLALAYSPMLAARFGTHGPTMRCIEGIGSLSFVAGNLQICGFKLQKGLLGKGLALTHSLGDRSSV